MDETQARDFAERMDELGLRFREPVELTELQERSAEAVTLLHEKGSARFRVVYSPELTASALGWAEPVYLKKEPMLVLGPRVNARSAELFRPMGINYLDQAGNAFLSFEGVHIDVRGRKLGPRSDGAGAPRMTRGGVNLFSRKRSQVIFAILCWPELLSAPIRALAAAATVSLGQAQETLELLGQYGFLNEGRRLLPNRSAELIDLWVAAYPAGLGSAAHSFRLSGDITRLHATDGAIYVSGEAAVPDLLRAETLVAYSDELPAEVIRRHRWRRDDERPTIQLRFQWFRHPGSSEGPGVHTAPPLLIYADLLASQDGRQREAAMQLREKHHGFLSN
jgi:hypothetical protein